jgi:hypothetical protein
MFLIHDISTVDILEWLKTGVQPAPDSIRLSASTGTKPAIKKITAKVPPKSREELLFFTM